jgi:hypothetical protein
MVQQLLDVPLAIEIDLRVGMAVTYEEVAYPERPGAMVGTDEDDVANPAADELGPAEHERAHEHVAQLGIVLDQGQEMLAGNQGEASGRPRGQSHEQRPSGQGSHFAGELTHLENPQDGGSILDPDDPDLALQDDEDTWRNLAGLEQHFAGLVRALCHAGSRALELPVGKNGKTLRRPDLGFRRFNGGVHLSPLGWMWPLDTEGKGGQPVSASAYHSAIASVTSGKLAHLRWLAW